MAVSVTDEIKAYVVNSYLPEMQHTIDEDTSLFSEGMLDSVQMISFVLFLEESFNIRLDVPDINPENFKSIRAISSLVEQKVSAR